MGVRYRKADVLLSDCEAGSSAGISHSRGCHPLARRAFFLLVIVYAEIRILQLVIYGVQRAYEFFFNIF